MEGTPSAIEIADLDGNGVQDIVFCFSDKQNLVLLSNGFERFSEPLFLPGPVMETNAMAIGDMNGDSIFDLVIGNKNQ